jgi:hypothetical protein
MSTAAAHAAAFSREVAERGWVWGIRDEGGIPAPAGPDGIRAMPFWSSQARAERVIATVPAYQGFHAFDIAWNEFVERWLPGMARDGLRVGVNWSGERATGYDVEPEALRQNVEALLHG